MIIKALLNSLSDYYIIKKETHDRCIMLLFFLLNYRSEPYGVNPPLPACWI